MYNLFEFIHNNYKEIIHCTKNNQLYIYYDHRWQKGVIHFKNYISVEVIQYYNEIIKHCDLLNNEQINNITSIQNNLTNTQFIKNIIKKMNDMYNLNNPCFEDNLNNDITLLGFTNGVFDLNNMALRCGKIDDYISLNVKYNFSNKYSNFKSELMYFLNCIIPNKNNLEMFLKYISLNLYNNHDKSFIVIYGNCEYYKNILHKLIKYTFGDYYGIIQPILLTEDYYKNRNNFFLLQNKKMVILNNYNDKYIFNSNAVKLITNNYVINTKLNNSDCYLFKITSGLILFSNKIPLFNNYKLSVQYIELSEKTHINNEYNFNIINNNLEFWKQDFMLLLIEYYNKYSKNK
jgi:phage/plasmid-associated DNA primase